MATAAPHLPFSILRAPAWPGREGVHLLRGQGKLDPCRETPTREGSPGVTAQARPILGTLGLLEWHLVGSPGAG